MTSPAFRKCSETFRHVPHYEKGNHRSHFVGRRGGRVAHFVREKGNSCRIRPDTIAVVEGNVISKAAFEAALRQRARAASRPENLATHKETVLKELVEFEALYAKACAAGWQTNAELVSGFKRAVVSRFKEEALAKPAVATQSEAEIQNHYAQQAAQFTRPGQTRAAILFWILPAKVSDEKRQELRQRDSADPPRSCRGR